MKESEFLLYADFIDELAETNSDYGLAMLFKTPIDVKECVLKKIDRIEEIDRTIPNVERKIKGQLSGEKGYLLEEIAACLLGIRKIFKINERVLCSSNEIDLLMQPNTNNALYQRLLPEFFRSDFLVECKNHSKKIDVTLVGKFYSLIKYKKASFGIMFTNKPLKGVGEWDSAIGLTKKLSLASNTIIINITLNEIKDVLESDTIFIEILKKKVDKIIYHTEFKSDVSKHPAEDKMETV